MDYFQQQNLIFFDSINDLFELKKHRTWDDLAKSITEFKMKRTYRKFGELFPRKHDYAADLEAIPAGFNTIHYGRLKGTTIIDEVVRFSLYADTVIVFHPLQNPVITNQQVNPGKNPKLWLPDFINAIYFYIVIQKWVRAGIVKLIVNPFDYDEKWHSDIIAKATKRVNATDRSDKLFMDETKLELAEQFASSINKNESEASIKAMLLALNNPVFSDEEATNLSGLIKEAIPKVNPLFNAIPKSLITSQISTSKGGGPLESILTIAELTGSHLYTPSRMNWHTLQLLKKDDFWMKLNHVYSKVDLPYLNNVSTEFALNIRQEGRLAGVRTEFKKIFSELDNVLIENISEKNIGYLYEGFVDEIRKSETDWNAIKKESLITRQHMIAGAAASPIMAKFPTSILPIIGSVGLSLAKELRSTKIKQEQFRVKNPVSVFVDVQQKQEGFFAQLKNCVF